jgi:hypothetical protein
MKSVGSLYPEKIIVVIGVDRQKEFYLNIIISPVMDTILGIFVTKRAIDHILECD